MAIRTELSLGIRNFQQGLEQARADVRRSAGEMRREMQGASVGESMAGGLRSLAAPLAGIAGLTMAMRQMKGAMSWADDLADLTLKLNDNAEALQRVDFAAQQMASIGVSQVADAMMRLERSLGDVGNEKASDALARLGVTAGELQRMSLDEKMVALSAAFQRARADGTGLYDIQQLLGRSAGELVPMLEQGEEALRSMFEAAPVLADETVQRLAEMNDQLDALVLKSKGFVANAVAGASGIGQFLADVLETGSIEEAQLRLVDRETDRARGLGGREENRAAQAEAQEAARASAAAAKEEEIAARDLEKALEDLAKARGSVAARDFAGLGDSAQLDTLKTELDGLLQESVGLFSLNFSQSVEGLRALAESRLAMGDALPAEGQNSAAEAFTWLDEALRLEAEIAKRQEAMAAAEESRQAAEEEARRRSRESAERAEFALLDPEEQIRALRDQIARSLGVSGDREGMLAEARRRKEAEDFDGAAQIFEAVAQMDRIAERVAEPMQSRVSANEQGSVASLMDQIFGRGTPAEKQLEELRQASRLQGEQVRRLDDILRMMGEPPPQDQFDDFGV
jgi:hypothetical protein